MVEGRGREATIAVAVIAVVGAVALGYFAWRDRVQGTAHTMLADAMAVADTRVGPPIAPGHPGRRPELPDRARPRAGRPRHFQGDRRRLSDDRRRHLRPLPGGGDPDVARQRG